MKQGRSLTELAQELERQLSTKKDFKAPTSLLEVRPAALNLGDVRDSARVPELQFHVGDKFTGGLTARAHTQVAAHTGIPSKYYDRLRVEAPGLLATNVNHWLHSQNTVQLVRTLDGRARAFLSNKYRTIDNYEIADATLPLLTDAQVEVVSSEVTEDRLYIKAVTKKLTFEVKKGDVVQMGIVISNSEVGLGAVRVEPLLYRLICLNGAILEDQRVRKFHIGRLGNAELEQAYEVFRDETRKADDRAFIMKLQDVVRGAFDETRFRAVAETTREADGRLIPGKVDPQNVVEVIVDQYHLDEDTQRSVISNLIKGGSLSQWGLANAVTATANEVDNYEKATELERVGGNIITMDDSVWKRVMVQAAAA